MTALVRPAAPRRSGSRPRSTTRRSRARPTCRTCSPPWSRGAWPARPAEHLALSGQGVRDVTRIAAGDPGLWQQIVTANSAALSRPAAARSATTSTRLLAALETNTRRDLGRLLERGIVGTAAIPGKHGGPAGAETGVFVAVPDHPGELARLFADVGEIGVNIEDVRIDHDPGRPVGLVELTVAADRSTHLQAVARGSAAGRTHG